MQPKEDQPEEATVSGEEAMEEAMGSDLSI